MPLRVVLVDKQDQTQGAIPDPAGGLFDAAGDFDRLGIDESLPLWSSVDPDTDTEFTAGQAGPLLAEVDRLRALARSGAEARGLDRLAALLARCQASTGLRVRFIGN
jgi:hypothetical protein